MEIKNFLGQNFIVFDTIDETVEYAIKNMNGQTVNAYTVADWSFEWIRMKTSMRTGITGNTGQELNFRP